MLGMMGWETDIVGWVETTNQIFLYIKSNPFNKKKKSYLKIEMNYCSIFLWGCSIYIYDITYIYNMYNVYNICIYISIIYIIINIIYIIYSMYIIFYIYILYTYILVRCPLQRTESGGHSAWVLEGRSGSNELPIFSDWQCLKWENHRKMVI
jgi:hypothetical protein